MIFLILSGIIGILLLVSYIVTLNKNLKLQNKVIEDQKGVIERERIAHKFTKAQYDLYYRSYVELVDKFNSMFGERETKMTGKKKELHYDMDDILNEISKKGIKNIDKDKLDFLRKYGKGDNKG